MTQIMGYVPPTRRQGQLGVHSLDHFSMVVPDLQQAQDFYALFGLDARREGQTVGLYAPGNPHRWGIMGEGKRKKLHYLSFGAFADDLPKFRQRIDQAGVERMNAPPGFESNGIWFRNPDGLPIEIKAAEKVSPNAKMPTEFISSTAGVRGAALRSQAPIVHPRRLAHLAVYSSDVLRSIAFYRDVLGLRLSDKVGGHVAFMHGIHGSDHHLIAIGHSEGPGLHHCSWDVGSVQDVGLGAMQMAARGFTAGWGMGRHVLGSNYFHYVRDPWGSHSEYSADMDYIPVTQDWQDADQAPEDAFYLWGPNPPEDFTRNYEVA